MQDISMQERLEDLCMYDQCKVINISYTIFFFIDKFDHLCICHQCILQFLLKNSISYSRGKKDTSPYNISPMEMRSIQQSITCIKDLASPLN